MDHTVSSLLEYKFSWKVTWYCPFCNLAELPLKEVLHWINTTISFHGVKCFHLDSLASSQILSSPHYSAFPCFVQHMVVWCQRSHGRPVVCGPSCCPTAELPEVTYTQRCHPQWTNAPHGYTSTGTLKTQPFFSIAHLCTRHIVNRPSFLIS